MGDRTVEALCVGPKNEKAGKGDHCLPTSHTDSAIDPRSVREPRCAVGQRWRRVSAPAIPRSRSHAVTFPRDLTCRLKWWSDEIGANTNEVVASPQPLSRSTGDLRAQHPKAPSTDPDVITAAARHALDLLITRPVAGSANHLEPAGTPHLRREVRPHRPLWPGPARVIDSVASPVKRRTKTNQDCCA